MKKEPKVYLDVDRGPTVVNVRFIEPVMLGKNCEIHSALMSDTLIDSLKAHISIQDDKFLVIRTANEYRTLVPMSNVASMLMK